MKIDLDAIQKESSSRKPQKANWSEFFSRDINFGRKRLADKKKERFYNQLGVLFSSGIDLGTALQIIIDDEGAPKVKSSYQTIFDDIVMGQALSEAMQSTGQFTEYEFYSIQVGEESGRLQEVLKELASYYALRVQQRRQISGALSYPIMVLVVAIAAVIFMFNVVVPMFSGVFLRFGGELPPITQAVLNLSEWFSDNLGWLFFLVIIVTIILLYLRRYNWYKSLSARLVLRMPFAGKLVKLLVHARFCHSVSLLTHAQVPLLQVLDMVQNMIRFYPMKTSLEKVKGFIEGGKHMYEGMEQQKLFDRQLVSITKVGEEVNQIGPLYSKLYDQYTQEIKHMTSVLGNMLEPVMIVVVGLLVMVILIAMYLPLFQLSSTVF